MSSNNLPNLMLRLIQQHEAPEAIFVVAQATIQYDYINLFFNVPESTEQPDAYLLLMIIDADTRQCTQMQGRLENILQPVAAVTCWCLPLSTFNEMLMQGQYFACTVRSHAERLFIAGDANLLTPSITPPFNKYQGVWYQRAQEFYAGAELYTIRKQYAMAAFHLHQCAEQCLTSIIYNKSGYRPATHNLLLLYRYACWFEPLLHALFSPHKLKEAGLLHLLQRAYTGSRYSEEYTIKGKQLEMIRQKTQQLLSMAKITDKAVTAKDDTTCTLNNL